MSNHSIKNNSMLQKMQSFFDHISEKYKISQFNKKTNSMDFFEFSEYFLNKNIPKKLYTEVLKTIFLKGSLAMELLKGNDKEPIFVEALNNALEQIKPHLDTVIYDKKNDTVRKEHIEEHVISITFDYSPSIIYLADILYANVDNNFSLYNKIKTKNIIAEFFLLCNKEQISESFLQEHKNQKISPAIGRVKSEISLEEHLHNLWEQQELQKDIELQEKIENSADNLAKKMKIL